MITGIQIHFFNVIVNLWYFFHYHYPALLRQMSHIPHSHYRHAVREFHHWAMVLYRKMT